MFKSEITTYPEYYKNYFALVKEINLMDALKERTDNVLGFYTSIPDDKWDYKYADDKWTIKKVVRHIIDCELILLYRVISIARGETQSLPGFDESKYGNAINESLLSKEKLLNSITIQALYTYDFFKSIDSEDFHKIGTANGHKVSVGALGYAIIGHDYHHRKMLNEFYQ